MARGVLVELLSHSDGWEINADSMWRQARKHGNGRGAGRRAYRAAFAELEECGYLIRETIRGEHGQFITVLAVYDIPQHRGAASGTPVTELHGESRDDHADRGTANATSVRATSVDATSVSGTSIRSTNLRSTKEEVTDQEDSATLAKARVGALAPDEDQLSRLYQAVERLGDTELGNCLAAFERKRPRIYRECRNAAIGQLETENPRVIKSNAAGRRINVLSYKYAIRHYSPEWPLWLVRSLQAVMDHAA